MTTLTHQPLPPPPPPNGDERQDWIVLAAARLLEYERVEHERDAGWFKKQITLGNIIVIGALLCSMVVMYARAETHVQDTAIHWTRSDLDAEIDSHDALMNRPPKAVMAEIAVDIKEIKGQLGYFRSDRDTDWQRLKERVLILEQARARSWRPKNSE